jgi:hypothetical protein
LCRPKDEVSTQALQAGANSYAAAEAAHPSPLLTVQQDVRIVEQDVQAVQQSAVQAVEQDAQTIELALRSVVPRRLIGKFKR